MQAQRGRALDGHRCAPTLLVRRAPSSLHQNGCAHRILVSDCLDGGFRGNDSGFEAFALLLWWQGRQPGVARTDCGAMAEVGRTTLRTSVSSRVELWQKVHCLPAVKPSHRQHHPHQLGDGVYVQFGHDGGAVGFDGFDRDGQVVGDLFVQAAGHDAFKHLAFAAGQAGDQ